MHKLNFYVLLCTLVMGGAAFGQGQPYPIGSSTTVLNNVRQQLNASRQQSGISRLELKVSPSLSLPAAINYRLSSGQNQEQMAGSIEHVPNSSFYLFIENKTVRGHIILGNSKTAYEYTSDEGGNVFVEEKDINKLVCINYDQATVQDNSTPAANTSSGSVTANAVAAVTDLQSYPGGNGCVLLDFDGQLVQGTPWNNGNPINAAPANLTDAEKQAIWEMISEDYRPFHLNVTTSETVFNTYPKTRRMRCIFTPTNTAAPGAGGVAYLGSFRWNDDTPCWVFNGGIKGAGEAGSHEVGHTFGLGHDGRTSPQEGYYRGHGDWAPIMGVGYYEPISQWSKGEYANANNTEDDLAKISSTTYGVGYRADDYGNTIATAGALSVAANGTVSSAGLIERTGEIDMLRFTTGGGTANLTFTSSAVYDNLDILATLYDGNGAVVATSNPAGLHASISTTLAAGTYYVSVTGTGAGDPATNGYSNYASLGSYTITGTVAGGSNTAIATFYKDCNYAGTAVGLNAGSYTTAQLVAGGILDNDISSIRIGAGYEVVLYKNDNFTGGSITLTGDQACLVSNTWNDSASSLVIRSTSNTLPSVTISSPSSGSSHAAPASIAINVNATDADGTISKVEFYNGNTKLGEDATTPFSYVWSNIVAGSYTIRVVAIDDRGGQSTAQVNVSVSSGTGAVVYKHCNYGGYAISLPIGTYTLNQLLMKGALNNDISSLQVNSGYEIVLYNSDNFQGSAYLFRGNFGCLVSVGLSNGTTVNLNDWTTSVVVRQSTARTTGNSEAVSPLEGAAVPSLTVSPNPATNRVIIQYGEPGSYFDVDVIDVNGAVVSKVSRMKSGQPLNVASLKTGVYFVRINTGKDIVTKKIIKR
jgi:hypothetical protein